MNDAKELTQLKSVQAITRDWQLKRLIGPITLQVSQSYTARSGLTCDILKITVDQRL